MQSNPMKAISLIVLLVLGGFGSAQAQAQDYGTMVKKGQVFVVTSNNPYAENTMTDTITDVTSSDIVYIVRSTMTMGGKTTTLLSGEEQKFSRQPAKDAHVDPREEKVRSGTTTISGVEVKYDVYEMADPTHAGTTMQYWMPTNLPPFIVLKIVDGTGKVTMELTEIKGG
jgi:hypothetical protein